MKTQLVHRWLLPLLAVIVCPLYLSIPVAAQTRAIAMPVDLEIYLLTVSGIRELQPEWTEAGSQFAQDAFDSQTDLMFDAVSLPELTEEERMILDEHIALFDVAVTNSISMIKKAKMKHKIDNYDYTLGPGLAWLAEKSGAEKIVMYTGEVEESSDGRAMMTVLSLAVGVATGVYVIQRIDASYNYVGIVDLASGNLEWVNYRNGLFADARTEEGATKNVTNLFSAFPEGKLMRTDKEY